MAADEVSLQAVNDIGPQVAHHVHTFFRQPHNLDILTRLLDAGIVWPAMVPQSTSQPLHGFTFVLTGVLQGMTRDEAKRSIKNAGGHVASQVSQSTSYLLAGASPGSKLKDAEEKGIPVLNEDAFNALLARCLTGEGNMSAAGTP